MRSTCPPPARDRDRPSDDAARGGRRRSRLVATTAALFLLSTSSVLAQTSFLRGGFDGPDAPPPADDTPTTRRARPQAPAPVASDLLGLGETPSPLDAARPAGSAETGPVLDRIGAPAATPATGTAATTTTGPTTTGTTTNPATSAAERRRRAGPTAPVAAATPPEGTGAVTATAAVEPARRSTDATAEEAEKEDDAYAPLGLRSGGMVWYPALEASVGRKSNVDSTRGGRGSSTWMFQPSLIGRSDWSRHSLEITLRGSETAYPEASDQTRAEYEGKLRGRLDLGDETALEVGAGWSRRRESTSANEASTAGEGTDRQTGSASLGLTRDVGFLALTLRGAYERNDYVANGSPGAGVTDPSVQNNALWTGSLRTTFGPKQSIAPFVELRTTARRYDQSVVYGQRRDGDGAAALVGFTADAGPTLRGELATGWGFEKPADSSLATMSGWLLEGSLTWSPTRLAVVKTKLTSSFEPTTNQGSPGTITRGVAVDLDYALRRDVTVTLGAGLDAKHYFGIDVDERTASLSGGLTYKFDRNFQTFLRGRFERTGATNADAYDVVTITTGVRIQR